MFGHQLFVNASLYSSDSIVLTPGTTRCESSTVKGYSFLVLCGFRPCFMPHCYHLTACLGSVHCRTCMSAAMRSDTLGSACDPLLPLNRWIHYTQTELQSVRADLLHHREEELAVRRLQQSQLDSLQAQIRELAQQQTEISEQMTEVANAVTDMFHQLGVLRCTLIRP